MKLTITDLTKKFGHKTAVNHVDLELTPGIIGLLGPNGAGKTTMIRLLCDLIQPDSGAVLLDGENIRFMGEDYRDILGYLPQKVGYYPWFTAEKYLMYIAALKGLSTEEAAAKTKDLLEQVGLYSERKKRLGAFSGGMLQRVGIAQALLNDPKILILDEPTAGLDPQERIRFRTMIAGLARDRLVILSTHIVTDVEHIATQVVMLRSGKVVAHDTIGHIRNTLTGKVCTLTVSAEEAEQYRQTHLVANMQPVGEKIMLRLVCPNGFPDGAVPVEPDLEDAYLAYCGREDVC
ncbi:MAG: ABC transporter ATP-binding protein [Oscillospiraceae bacterium]|nr:ABC transporter ATP-binding protein [Oscillospiraceae bacterium]MBO5323209.1 ABC transporter ATP-binding protein [Oscillospiraceae bacterium]